MFEDFNFPQLSVSTNHYRRELIIVEAFSRLFWKDLIKFTC